MNQLVSSEQRHQNRAMFFLAACFLNNTYQHFILRKHSVLYPSERKHSLILEGHSWFCSGPCSISALQALVSPVPETYSFTYNPDLQKTITDTLEFICLGAVLYLSWKLLLHSTPTSTYERNEQRLRMHRLKVFCEHQSNHFN